MSQHQHLAFHTRFRKSLRHNPLVVLIKPRDRIVENNWPCVSRYFKFSKKRS